MHVALVHHQVDSSSSIADRDVFDQIGLIESVLSSAGHTTSRHMLDAAMLVLDQIHSAIQPGAIFNLVETFRGRDRWMHLAARRMDELQIPYTGSPASTLQMVNDKHFAKLRMHETGVPTAPWLATEVNGESNDARCDPSALLANVSRLFSPGHFIIKSRFEHASVNLEQDAVSFFSSIDDLRSAMLQRVSRMGPCVAERFIDGREFNLSLLEMDDGQVQVMPPAEIDFHDFPANQHRIVGYRAKWVEDSVEYNATPRRFLNANEDQALARELQRISVRCWSAFELRGYARIDFRVDQHGQPWILEINANPCIAPWSGFTAACDQASISPDRFVRLILNSALRGRSAPIKSEPIALASGVDVVSSGIATRCMRSLGVGTSSVQCVATPSTHVASANGLLFIKPVLGGGSMRQEGFDAALTPSMQFRWEVTPDDASAIEELVRMTGFFDADEVLIARELVEERLATGPDSGYEFLIVTDGAEIAGYTCFGHIACTKNAWDLYWIAVGPKYQRRGLGRWLAKTTEAEVFRRGGRGLYIDTSGREQYRSTRQFYENCGYTIAANFPDFYDTHDPKLVYAKRLQAHPTSGQ